MEITGAALIGGVAIEGEGAEFYAFDPAAGKAITPAFRSASPAQIDEACRLAGAAFDEFRSASLESRAIFLEAVAQGILDLGDALIERAMEETGLPRARLEGERGRTVGQLRMFAQVVRQGLWLTPTLDSALPERVPLPRPDLRMRKIPLGPVAVFGASNFPLAFSVAGGDTASALAAGCPVVVKAHPSHPGTSELVGRAMQRAVAGSHLPVGVFSLVGGNGNAVGEALAAHPSIAAVGFTGSRGGGLALASIAARRPVPIPVFAEMSSVNPVFLLPGAIAGDSSALAQMFVDSATLGAGQFCTQPGIVVGIEGEAFDSFVAHAAQKMAAKMSSPMLNRGIQTAYEEGVDRVASQEGVAWVAHGVEGAGGLTGRPALFRTSGETFLRDGVLAQEVFGPSSIFVACRDEEEMLRMAEELEGQLTATLQMTAADDALARSLVRVLERKAGRILVNGFPTGVEVSHAMIHGGPFPATTNDRTTSVGATAIERFLRPVCYQNFPSTLLAAELDDENSLGLWRLRDGRLEQR